jgi:uncharacterized protein (UPF0333 family)
LNSAFIDIGGRKDAFLHYLDLGPQLKSLKKFTKLAEDGNITQSSMESFELEKDIEKTGKISDFISVGDRIPVQIAKEPINTKGPRITADISFAGRYIVLVPFSNRISVSQKIKSNEERKRLKHLIQGIKPNNFGVIVRTVAEGKKVEELDADLKTLIQKWENMRHMLNGCKNPAKLVSELDRTSVVLRDILNESFNGIYIDDANLYEEIKSFIFTIAPQKLDIVKLHKSKEHIFEEFGVNKQIAGLFGRITPKSIIKKLHLNQCTSPSISSSASSGVGLLIGSCYGTIINCSVTNSTVTTTESYPTGGLVGNLHKSGNIINSFVQNTKVTSEGFVGSIAGSMNKANITNCYAASNTIKTGTYNGGIAGSAINSNITNCYIYKITHSNTTGRGQIIGEAQSSKIYRIFYDKTTITLIKNDINESNTISFNRGYNTENFKTNKENIEVFQLLNQWVEEQGDNSIYTFWKGSTNLPAVFTE